MKRLVRPQLITFDVTGTLLMTKLETHYITAAENHGITGLDEAKIAIAFKTSLKRLEKQHPIFGRTSMGWENWWKTVVHDVFMDQDRGIPKETMNKIAVNLVECYKTKECWHKYPGTTELLESLSQHPVLLGIISNFDARLENILHSVNLKSYFSFVLTSYDFGTEKPNPDIFKEALKISSKILNKNIRPNEAIHIGDRLDNDYLGAHHANWNAILVNHNSKSYDETKISSKDIFKNLEEVKIHLETLFHETVESRS